MRWGDKAGSTPTPIFPEPQNSTRPFHLLAAAAEKCPLGSSSVL